MSWLGELERDCNYSCEAGHKLVVRLQNDVEAPDSIDCPEADCLCKSRYMGFEPIKLKQVNVVSYEKNGRVAYRIKDKGGKISHISKTKYVYLKTGRVENQYTPQYQEFLHKMQQERMMQGEAAKRPGGQVGHVSLEDELHDLPDGEYSVGEDGKATPLGQQAASIPQKKEV